VDSLILLSAEKFIFRPCLNLITACLELRLKLFFFFFNLIFFFQISFLVFFYCFDVLMSKINIKKIKNIILIHFKIKNILKNNFNYAIKHFLSIIMNELHLQNVCAGLIMEDIHISIYILVKINFLNDIKNYSIHHI
jgi:hypothetical protein